MSGGFHSCWFRAGARRAGWRVERQRALKARKMLTNLSKRCGLIVQTRLSYNMMRFTSWILSTENGTTPKAVVPVSLRGDTCRCETGILRNSASPIVGCPYSCPCAECLLSCCRLPFATILAAAHFLQRPAILKATKRLESALPTCWPPEMPFVTAEGRVLQQNDEQFDFNIDFEQVFFAILPSALFVASSLWRTLRLARKATVVNAPICRYIKGVRTSAI